MITLITGSPGTGKTAWLIQELIDLKKTQPYREIFIHGIKDFTAFEHTTIYCRSKLCDLCSSQAIPENALFVENYPDWFKAHFLIVVDEVQRIWTQSNGSNCTEAISRLQTHRHYGLDFWLVSQSPKLIHADVKAMIGRHVHLVSNWAGRKQYEFPECRENTASRSDAVVRNYKLPSEIFKFYKSAEVHTKQEKRKPLSFYFVIGIFVTFFCLAGYMAVHFSKPHESEILTVEAVGGVGGASAPPAPPIAILDNDLTTLEGYNKALTPITPSLPYTAPIYKEMVKPVSFPRLVGCIQSPSKCSCYTQQGTIVDLPIGSCEVIINNKSFNMFKPDKTDFITTPSNDPVASHNTVQEPHNFLINN